MPPSAARRLGRGWWRTRRSAGPGTAQLVGTDAAVAGRLRDQGYELVDDGGEVVVVLDPDAKPAKLPRAAVRVAVVAAGDAGRWRDTLAVEDADIVVAGAEDAAVLEGRTAAPPLLGDVHRVASAVAAWRARPLVHIVTGVSNLNVRHRWGDHHYALALARGFGDRGWAARTWTQHELPDVDHGAADLALLLAGKVTLAPVPGVPTLAWVISHPDRLAGVDLGRLDHVHVASASLAQELAASGVAATPLLQATDPHRFRPTPGGPAHELLFVANSRGVRRRILDDLLPTDHELAVYGYGWTPELLDPVHLVAEHLPNAQLPAAYTAAQVVLNDHWDDMRAQGLYANRLFDAAACGAAVVSDHLDGIDALFDGGVTTYRDGEDLRQVVDGLLRDPARREELGARARAAVLAGHTFADRVDALLAHAPVGTRP